MRFIFIIISMLLARVALAQSHEIVVSVGPIAALVKPIIKGQADISLSILNESAAVHDQNITPKQARRLESAERVYWFGPQFEHGMANAIENLAGERLLALSTTDYSGHEHGDEHDDEHDDEQAAHPHPWLNLADARALVHFIVEDLITLVPHSRDELIANQKAFLAKIDTFEKNSTNKINELRDNYYISDHPSFNEFAAYFQLNPVMAIQQSEERTPSVKRMRAVKDFIDAHQVGCLLFTNPAKKRMLAQSFPKLKPVYVDVIGVSVDYQYIPLMQGLIDEISTCASNE